MVIRMKTWERKKIVTSLFLCSCCSGPLCPQKGWYPPPLCRLQRTQQDCKERPLPTSTYLWPPRCSEPCQDLPQDWPLTCIPFGPHCWRWCMEDFLPHALWLLWMASHAIWSNQCPCCIPAVCNTVFANLLDVCVIVYLDDILIYSEDKASHREHVQEVLQCLCKHGLYAKPEKCEFHTDSTKYLGYCLSLSGLTMSEVKVQAIQDWPKSSEGHGYTILPQFCQLLLPLHLQLLRNHHSFNLLHLQGYSLELLWQLLLSLPAS